MGKKTIWDILEWVSMFIFLTYLYLKLIGVLKSPPPIDAIAIISLAFFMGKQVQKINNVTAELGVVKLDMSSMKRDIDTVKLDLREVKVTLTHHVNDNSSHNRR